MQALHFLTTQADEGTVHVALSNALADADVAVKRYAMQALAERGGPGALASLEQARRDPDPTIRLSALESLVATEQGRPWLQEALDDEDATVRAFAVFWLEREEEQ